LRRTMPALVVNLPSRLIFALMGARARIHALFDDGSFELSERARHLVHERNGDRSTSPTFADGACSTLQGWPRLARYPQSCGTRPMGSTSSGSLPNLVVCSLSDVMIKGSSVSCSFHSPTRPRSSLGFVVQAAARDAASSMASTACAAVGAEG
jgi:hypothetical protein